MLFFASQSGLMRLSCDGKLRARAKIDLTIVFRVCVHCRVPAGQGRMILRAGFVTASQFRNNQAATDNESF